MKVVSFSVNGKMAHFRKVHSNASVLSYFLPPRTTISGIVAGLLGMERDTYYETFSIDNCKIAVACQMPIKKCMQKLNHLMIKSKNDLNGSAENHSQAATELVIPLNIRTGYVSYQIWIHHSDNNIMEKLEWIVNDMPMYYTQGISVALGTAFNLGWIEKKGVYEAEEVYKSDVVDMYSAIPMEYIDDIKLQNMTDRWYRLIKEEVPLEFTKGRKITERGLKNILINIEGSPIKVTAKQYVKLDNGLNIMWMQ
ncbi:CRISPR-associated protein Cas5 [Thermoanaerobacterium thermosaccharolyticum]|uniref:CRISPR-associated protein Cas5 n=1 Tax=Thermoanaerobacterium thermosaccharolyticum TaxID=1517 RepID=A0A231VNJ0_THETR|nr:CRISPR-associated protein Cas5 [Thermoanaerobacterium thermosaccharolyticum]MCP2239496.1 CRISPR-associated protein Cas5h [Thermoanaerobacterium thermosaccharolyticum]OXT09531.1 CRISPR-associated protein Cas5 [Thermoanaerobacterium thermosaccharolyticum]